MEMRSCVEDDWLIVFHLQGEIDAETGPDFREALEQARAEGQRWFLIDLLEAEYLDSVALGILLGTAKETAKVGGRLAVACNRPNLVKLFELAGVKELLNVQETAAAARSLLEQAHQTAGQSQDGGE